MADLVQQQSIVSLALAAETCNVSAATLSSSSSASTSVPSPNLRHIHADLLSLLSFIYQATTKLSIALNPTDPTYSASISPLGELVKHINALTSCAALFDNNTHGKTLRTEVIDLVSNVLNSLSSLINTFLLIARDGAKSVLKDEYLIRTGTVHNLIDAARGPDGLSGNNLQAIRKKWAVDKATLDDAYGELAEMLQVIDAEDDDLSGDDDFDEFSLESTKKLSSDEVERVKKVQPLIRAITLLHKRVLVDLLAPSASSLPPESPQLIQSLDILVKVSSDVVSTTDDLIATLYGPQDPSSIPSALTSLSQVARGLQSNLVDNGYMPQKSQDQVLVQQLGSMAIHDNKSPTTNVKANPTTSKVKDIRGWFDTCFTQIDRLCISLCESFNND